MIRLHDIKCTGCTACQAICPTGAITMTPDAEGFLFPVIDEVKCVGCDLCGKVCHIDNTRKYPYQDYCYVATSANEEDLNHSSSGAVFPMLARHALKNNGIVCGCIFDENTVARHVLSDDHGQIRAMSGSKYVQSDMGDCFRQTKANLEKGKFVLFTGTPCQVGGLMKFLGKDYENLMTMDFACHGVPSPLLLQHYMRRLKELHPDVSTIKFRNKKYGWRSGLSMTWLDKNGNDIKFLQYKEDVYASLFANFSSLRKSCPNCMYCTPQRSADFTVGDHWSIGKTRNFNDRGTSFILCNTSKSLDWLKNNEDEFQNLERISLKYIGQPHFWMPYFRGKQRGMVFKAIKDGSICSLLFPAFRDNQPALSIHKE